MTWLTLERFHPINRLTTFLIDSSALLLLGLPPAALIANMLVRHYYGYLIHADLPWTYGPLGRVFVSPAMHRWHHAADKAAFDTNYATVFSIFDQAFGTYRVPGPCTVPLGVTDDMAPTLAGQMSYAFSPRAYRRRKAKSVARGHDGPAFFGRRFLAGRCVTHLCAAWARDLMCPWFAWSPFSPFSPPRPWPSRA
jgi:hypothetical protein